MKKNIFINALVGAGTTSLYIIFLVTFLTSASNVFDDNEPQFSVFVPALMLLLFVISATVTGIAVLGKPIIWFLEGKKQHAVSLLGLTIGFLVLIALIFVVIIF